MNGLVLNVRLTIFLTLLMVSVCDALAYVKSVSKFQMVLCMPKCAFCAQMVLT